jgi:hypothetical protein
VCNNNPRLTGSNNANGLNIKRDIYITIVYKEVYFSINKINKTLFNVDKTNYFMKINL